MITKELKEELVAEMKAHQAADRFVQGIYSEGKDDKFKGCAVGCAIESLNRRKGLSLRDSDHSGLSEATGVPTVLFRLEDRIFESLSTEESKQWPVDFFEALPGDTNLDLVWPKLAIWLMTDDKCGVLQYAKSDKSKKTIKTVADLYQKQINGQTVTKRTWNAAYAAADAAYADAAYAAAAYAAADAAAAAYAAADADAAAAAADAAAYAAADAAYADAAYAADAADAAAYAAADAAAADAADARRAFCTVCADKLLEILRETK